MFDEKDLITTSAACRLAGGNDSPIHPSTLWRWVKDGKVSPPVYVGPNTVRYRRDKLIVELGLGEVA